MMYGHNLTRRRFMLDYVRVISCLLLLLIIINIIITALHGMQHGLNDEISVCPSVCLSVRPSVCLSVCPSVKRVHCDKTEEKSVRIFIPCERPLCLLL